MLEVPGEENNDVDIGGEETSGQVPKVLCQSGWECCARVRDDDARYSVSSYNRNHQPSNTKQVGANYVYMAHTETPHTYDDAMSHPEANAWRRACQDELLFLKETRTYIPVSTNDIGDVNIVSCHWVFAIKQGPNGSIKQYKARIVAKGFSQEYQIDYDETFAPVVKWDSIHILLALAA